MRRRRCARFGTTGRERLTRFWSAASCRPPRPVTGRCLIAPVRNDLGEPLGDAEPMLSLGEQHDAAIRSDPSAIKGGGDLLALNGWKGERQQIIVGHGGRGVLRF